MKLNYTLIWAMIVGMLLGSSAWAEKATMPMEERAMDERTATEHEMKGMDEQHHEGMMEQTSDADMGMQDKKMNEAQIDEAKMNEPMEMEQSGFSRGSVVRSVFTSAVDEREPTDSIKELSSNSDKVIYYTELRDMAGQTAKHRWEHNGEVMAEVEFKVEGARWRVWSSKSFVPGWTGEWKVSVLNGANEVISEDVLNYTAEMAMPEAAPAAEAPAAVENMQAQ